MDRMIDETVRDDVATDMETSSDSRQWQAAMQRWLNASTLREVGTAADAD